MRFSESMQILVSILKASFKGTVGNGTRIAALNIQIGALTQMSRSQTRALRASLINEHQARLDAERRLVAVEHSRSWRIFPKLRSLFGRTPLPRYTPISTSYTEGDLNLVDEIRQSGLFDAEFYLQNNPDIAEQKQDPALHFARAGWKEGRRPRAEFDTRLYLTNHPEVVDQEINPLTHFAQYGLDDQLAAALGGGRVEKDLQWGLTEAEAAEVEAVRATGLFDSQFYLARNPTVAADKKSSLSHFALVGWHELRDPNVDFDTAFYLSENADVAADGINPLVHYASQGKAEGRAAKPNVSIKSSNVKVTEFDLSIEERNLINTIIETQLFDLDWYLSTYPDVASRGDHPIAHFALSGWREGRNPSPSFDVNFYLAQNPDVVASDVNPLLHYAVVGAAEGRIPLPQADPTFGVQDEDARLVQEIMETGLFEEAYYDAHNPDVAKDGIAPALHFARDGWREGRRPHSDFDTKFYADVYQDVSKLELNPLLHFSRDGILEGRRPNQGSSSDVHTGSAYAQWVATHDTLTDDDRRAIRARLTRLRYRPLISIVMPVYNTDLRLLREAISSVQAQLYPTWELCIADDASTAHGVVSLLRELADADPRIKLVIREQNGHISASSNSALAMATGEFVALMDHDDLIPEHALFSIAAMLNENPNFDIVYSDEDHIDKNGTRFMPYFKSDFNPDLFLGHNIISHLGVYRRDIIEKIGGFRVGYEGSQDYDLALRAVDAIDSRRILHIPSVLYHWRSSPGEATFSQDFLDRCINSARRAIKDHLVRTGQEGVVVDHPLIPSWHRVYRPRPDPAPLVSIIVPTKDKVEILEPCCEGILKRTDYPNIELIVVDHESTDLKTIQYLKDISKDHRVTVLPYQGIFNYSSINNAAVRHARGHIIAFLNNDVEVIESDWLDEMVSLANLSTVGAVGAKLLYADDRVQHGGVVVGVGGVANHFHHCLTKDDPGYMGLAVLTATVSAVTGACLVVRKEVFESVGGFDDVNLAVAFNDVDLCLKIRDAGLRNVMAAHAVLYHHESISRGSDTTPEKSRRFQSEVAFMVEKWGSSLEEDPFYNPNFDLQRPDHALAHPSRHGRLWSSGGNL